MLGLDTNVLIRYFTQDDPPQAERASRVIDNLTVQKPAFINVVTVVELYWVLGRTYKLDSESVGLIIRALLDSAEVRVDRPDNVRNALDTASAGADFADALIAEINGTAGCDYTLTFDRKAVRSAGMRHVDT